MWKLLWRWQCVIMQSVQSLLAGREINFETSNKTRQVKLPSVYILSAFKIHLSASTSFTVRQHNNRMPSPQYIPFFNSLPKDKILD